MTNAAAIQAKINYGYGKAASILGETYLVCRPGAARDLTDLFSIMVGSRIALFTNASSSGFNFTKGERYEDILWSVLADQTGLCNGDYLVTDQRAYFIVLSQPLTPPGAVLCNRRVTQLRANSQVDADGGAGQGMASQTGGSGSYFGQDRAPATSTGSSGEQALATNIPVALVPLADSARRGQGEVPSDAPGPGRWRMYLPVSVFPLGAVRNGDVFADDQGDRYQVATNGWTALGYKLEMIRLEN